MDVMEALEAAEEAEQFVIYCPARDRYWKSTAKETSWVKAIANASHINGGSAERFIEQRLNEFINCVYVKVIDDEPDYTDTLIHSLWENSDD